MKSNEELNKQIYFNIKKLVNKKKITMNYLETFIGVSSGYFSRLTKYKNEPSLFTIYKVSKALDVSLDYLVKDNRLEMINEEIAELEKERKKILGEKE